MKKNFFSKVSYEMNFDKWWLKMQWKSFLEKCGDFQNHPMEFSKKNLSQKCNKKVPGGVFQNHLDGSTQIGPLQYLWFQNENRQHFANLHPRCPSGIKICNRRPSSQLKILQSNPLSLCMWNVLEMSDFSIWLPVNTDSVFSCDTSVFNLNVTLFLSKNLMRPQMVLCIVTVI